MHNKYLILFLFLSTTIFSQNTNFDKTVDSITVLYKTYKKTLNPEISKIAINLVDKTQSDSLISKTYKKFGLKSFFKSDKKTLILIKENLKKLYKKNKDSSVLAQFYYIKGLEYRLLYKPDSAFYYLNRSKNISIALKDSLSVGEKYFRMGIVQYKVRDYIGTEATVIEGLKYVEPLNEIYFTVFLYKKLGNVLMITDRQNEAREVFKKAYSFVKNNNNNFDLAKLYASLGKTYESEGNNLKASEYYYKSLQVDSLAIKIPHSYDLALEGYSYNNFKLGNKELALKGYLEVLKSRIKRKDVNNYVFSYSLLGELYASTNQIKKAIYHTKEGLRIAKKINHSERILENLFLLSRLVKGEKGRLYLEEHFKLNDSLFKRERSIKNQFAKIRFETEKKDKENKELKIDNDRKQLQLESEKQQKTIGWLIAGAGIMFIGLGTTVVLNRRKKLLFESKLLQIEAREKERQQIAKSLHDEVAGDIRILHKKLEKNKLVEESKELDRVKENVRSLSHQLSSVSFDEVSFKNQIVNLVSDYFEADFRIKIKDINTVKWQDVNNLIKRTLFLSIREALQNIDKYAKSSNVIISFKESKKSLFLTINDNGKGFDTSSKKKGIGLKNMKERIEEINGVFSVNSLKEKGTTINIEIPKNGN